MKIQGQIWLGSRAFLERMGRLEEKRDLEEVPSAQAFPARPTKSDVLESVSGEYEITVEELVGRRDEQGAYRTEAYL
ncbi:MAG: hypothetical protein ACREOW_05820, partial [Thermodesulfobacteriota bacterium]